MSCTGGTARGPNESQRVTLGEIQNEPENDFPRRFLQFVNQSDEVKLIGNSVKAVHAQIEVEAFECRQQKNIYLDLRMNLSEAMIAGRIAAQYSRLYSDIEETCKNFDPKLRFFELKLEQAMELIAEWDGLAPFVEPDSEWIREKMQVNPEALQRELDEAKTKVDAANQFIQQLKGEWDSDKIKLSDDIWDAIEMAEMLKVVTPPQ